MTKKICTKCNQDKELTEFPNKKKNVLDSRCKTCVNKIRREKRKQKKELIKSLMSNKCQKCGFKNEKCLNNWMGKGRAKALLSTKNDTIINEMKQSLVLCCNCVSIKL